MTALFLFAGVKTYCDGRQDEAQCYGALRGSVDIQLMKSTSELPRYQLLKNSLKILDVKNDQVNMIGNRSTIIPLQLFIQGIFSLFGTNYRNKFNIVLITLVI